jgi:hypothetical protein
MAALEPMAALAALVQVVFVLRFDIFSAAAGVDVG